MSVQGLHYYLSNEIKIDLKNEEWEIDKLGFNDSMKSKNDNNKPIEGNLVLIIDGISFFYEIGKKLIYFHFDYKSFLERFEKKKKNLI